MLPKCIQEPVQDQNVAEGGSKGGAQTQSKNRRLLNTSSLLCSVMSVPLKLPFWSAPARSTCKYKSCSLSQVFPITTYCHPPLRMELKGSWWPWPQKSVHRKMSTGKERRSWRERCTPDLAIFVTFSLILSWWCLWSEWYKCGLISQQTAHEPGGMAVSQLSCTFFLSKNLPALGMTPLWHSHLFSNLPFPYPFHSSPTQCMQENLQVINIHDKNWKTCLKKKKTNQKGKRVAGNSGVGVPKLREDSVMGWIWCWTLTQMKTVK